LRQEAERRGTSPEHLALETLRHHFGTPRDWDSEQGAQPTLASFLEGYVGVVDGSSEAMSEHCGERFEAGLAESAPQGDL
jgi:hypothetical protein